MALVSMIPEPAQISDELIVMIDQGVSRAIIPCRLQRVLQSACSSAKRGRAQSATSHSVCVSHRLRHDWSVVTANSRLILLTVLYPAWLPPPVIVNRFPLPFNSAKAQ